MSSVKLRNWSAKRKGGERPERGHKAGLLRPSAPAPTRRLSRLVVRSRLGGPAYGRVLAGSLALPCMLGPAGFRALKREGDGATPVGRFALMSCFFRPDRGPRLPAALPCRRSRPDDGWCDDPRDPRYNQPVRLPIRAGHERMWRSDGLYDLGLVLDYNVSHPRKNRGSAIFIHVMSAAATPTAGCVALRLVDLRRLVPRLGAHCRVTLG